MNKESVTYRPKLWFLFAPLWFVPVLISWLISKGSDATLLLSLPSIGFFVNSLIVGSIGITFSDDEITKGSVPRRTLRLADIERIQYRYWFSSNTWFFIDNTLFVFVLTPRESKLESYLLSKGLSMVRYGWLPSDRRELFSRLLQLVETQNIEVDQKTLAKLSKTAQG